MPILHYLTECAQELSPSTSKMQLDLWYSKIMIKLSYSPPQKLLQEAEHWEQPLELYKPKLCQETV